VTGQEPTRDRTAWHTARTHFASPCDAEPIPVTHGSEQHEWVCGCGYRTPLCSDRRTARQALDQHRQETTHA